MDNYIRTLKIVLREDLNHYSPVGVEWYKGLLQSGFNVVLVPTDQQLVDYSTNLFINMGNIHTTINYVKKLKEINPQAFVLCTIQKPLEKLEEYFNYVDCWFDLGLSHPEYEEWFAARGQKFISVLEASNPDDFHNLNIPEDRKSDFSFIGQFGGTGHGYRQEDQYLYPLIDNSNLTHHLYGFSYGNVARRIIDFKNANLVYNSTRVNLNFHYGYQKDSFTVLNKRTFDLAVGGCFQLTDHPTYSMLFNEKSYPDPLDYIDAFYYFKDYTDERLEIVKRVQEIALAEHTWQIRMLQLINTIYNV